MRWASREPPRARRSTPGASAAIRATGSGEPRMRRARAKRAEVGRLRIGDDPDPTRERAKSPPLAPALGGRPHSLRRHHEPPHVIALQCPAPPEAPQEGGKPVESPRRALELAAPLAGVEGDHPDPGAAQIDADPPLLPTSWPHG